MKPVVITWGFSQNDGKPYLDCYLEIDNDSRGVQSLYLMELRGSTQGTSLALLKIPTEMGKDYIEDFIEANTEEVIKLLKSAKISAKDITRKGHEQSAIDFITCKS